MTTAHTISNEQIKALAIAAGKAQDVKMSAICTLALTGEFDGDDWGWSSARDRRAVEEMTQEQAVEACVVAINDASDRETYR